MFEDLAKDLEGVEAQEDRLGGYSPFEAGVYNAIVKAVYITDSQSSKSKCANIVLDIDGREFTDRVWFLRGQDGKPYYEKDGKKHMLPGFQIVNDLCLVITGHPLAENTPQEKTIKIYDHDAGGEVPKNLPVITQLLGQKVTVAIGKEVTNKQKKDEATGEYVDTDEKRVINSIRKCFHFETGKTVVELMSKANIEEADLFKTKWAEKNTGTEVNNFKEVGSAGPAAGSGAPAGGGGQKKSLFA